MQISAALIVLAAAISGALAQANPLASIPTCAQPCYTQAFASAGGSCNATDVACLCTNAPFVAAVTQCVATSCQGQDLSNAASQGQAVCSAALAAASASGSASASASASSIVSSAVSSASSSRSVISSSSASSASSTPIVSSSASRSTATSIAAPSTTILSPTPNSGANKLVAGAGLAGAAIAALLAL